MRKIKFRAWHKGINQMYDWQGVQSFGFQAMLEKGDIELMQFTGLKDKNRKEIYEGDILKRMWTVDGSDEVGYDYYICELNGQRWLHKKGYTDWSDILGNEEVMGNKFENPELLR